MSTRPINPGIIKFDFQGQKYSFNTDGWFNAMEAAERFGKKPAEWLRLPETVRYLGAMMEMAEVGKSHFVHTKRGGAHGGGGTWLHPKLAVRFAQWLDVKFAIWCDEQIDAIIRNGIRAEGNVNLLPLLLRPEAGHWELRFKPSYYQALARITHTTYTGHANGTPALYGAITDRWIYACLLPQDVHTELRLRRGASQKMHQWLTDGGQELLDKQIDLVTTIANTSTDSRDFEARMMAVSVGRPGQTGFIFPHAA